MDHIDLQAHRAQKDELFRGRHSPLLPAARAGFRGLHYYDPDPNWSLELELEPADGSPVTIETSDGAQRTYRRAGIVSFEAAGRPVRLTLYDTGHRGFFLPFRDATSGRETYGAGRYLDLDEADGGLVSVDFNLAYFPLCAYNDAYSCPLPPVENWLEVPVRAGERLGPGAPRSG